MYRIIYIILLIFSLCYIFDYKYEFFEENKVAVLTWYNEVIKDYGNITYKLNKLYCDLNNYDLIFSNKIYLPGRHPSWQKIKFIYEILNTNRYNYVIWIDADAVFNKENPNKHVLNNIIKKYSNKDIIFSNDIGETPGINCGIMIFKNSTTSKNFCKLIFTSFDNYCKKHFNKPNWEQECINYYYNKNVDNIKKKSVVLPFGILQVFNKNNNNIGNIQNVHPLIIHLAGTGKEYRVNFFKKYLKQ